MKRFGKIRFVNPEKIPSRVAEIVNEETSRVLSARTRDNQSFGVYLVDGDYEFYCGREFSKQRLVEWSKGRFVPHNQQTEDELGSIPATGEPKTWRWRAFVSQGEVRLKRRLNPTSAELQELADAAIDLTLKKDEDLIDLDAYECWVCDKDTLEPLALVLTATSQEEIERQHFSPLVRLGVGDLSNDFVDVMAARELQDEINERVNSSDKSGKVAFASRIFIRHFDNTSTEFRSPELGAKAVEYTQHPEGWLPSGVFAEPWQSRYEALERAKQSPYRRSQGFL